MKSARELSARAEQGRWRRAAGFVIEAMTMLAVVLVSAVPLIAQTPSRPTIGFLSANSAPAMSARRDAFRLGLRELGYVEPNNILVEYRYADGKRDLLPVLAAELVRLKVDVIVTEGTTATRFAKEATSTIPIVMAQDPDPVRTGFVASLAKPGGNITGLSNFRPELGGKRLELLREIVPRLTRVAVLGSSNTPGNAQALKEIEVAAGTLAVEVEYWNILAPPDIETAFEAARKARCDAVLVLASPVLLSNRAHVAGLATRRHLPAIYYTAEFVQDGGLISYGVDSHDLFRRAAGYVDRLLRGAKAEDLPVEQPTKLDLVINLKTAKALGLTIPPALLLRTDRVIE